MRGKTKTKNASLQCLGPTLLSQEKAANQSQVADTSSSPSMSSVPHCGRESPGSIFSQWAPISLTKTRCFSTMVIPCSCLGAVDLKRVTMSKVKVLIYITLKTGHNLQCTGYRNQKENPHNCEV